MKASDVDIKTAAMRACLSAGDYSDLPQILDYLAHESNREMDYVKDGGIRRLIGELHSVKLSPANMQLMGNVMATGGVELRRSACYAIRVSDDKAAIPYLKAALEDTDAEVRYDAMMGLYKITDNKPPGPPRIDDYLDNPNTYSDYIEYLKNKVIE